MRYGRDPHAPDASETAYLDVAWRYQRSTPRLESLRMMGSYRILARAEFATQLVGADRLRAMGPMPANFSPSTDVTAEEVSPIIRDVVDFEFDADRYAWRGQGGGLYGHLEREFDMLSADCAMQRAMLNEGRRSGSTYRIHTLTHHARCNFGLVADRSVQGREWRDYVAREVARLNRGDNWGWNSDFGDDVYSRRGVGHYNGAVFFTFDIPEDPEAAERGVRLLKEHLTPEQIKDYEVTKSFAVRGGHTGKTYRIHHGKQMNIHEIDAKGRPVIGVCFLPSGGLVSGDVMLAQKMALETDETAALAVANKFVVQDSW